MKLSHSKLQTILECPMSYFLNYKEGISLKEEKSALAIGSAVHWGIEHNTDELEEYYNEEGSFNQRDTYTKDQILAEGMVHGYLKHKDELMQEVLYDKETDGYLTVLQEEHELTLTAPLKSYRFEEDHEFLGIIDLLLVTDKGFVLIDYKTSSQTPDWTKYLDQIYRYIFLLKHNFPDVPVVKIGIINLKKTSIRQKANETGDAFLQRMKMEYEINDENYINTHMYDADELDPALIEAYIDNLSKMADTAELIDRNKMWFINFKNANGQYGKSQYWDIFYHTPDAYLLYKIRDYIFDDNEEKIVTTRPCVPLDMLAIEKPDLILNKYDLFKAKKIELFGENKPVKEQLFGALKKEYLTDDTLLDMYWETSENDTEEEQVIVEEELKEEE